MLQDLGFRVNQFEHCRFVVNSFEDVDRHRVLRALQNVKCMLPAFPRFLSVGESLRLGLAVFEVVDVELVEFGEDVDDA